LAARAMTSDKARSRSGQAGPSTLAEAELLSHREERGDMAVWQAPFDLEPLACDDMGLAAQRLADELDRLHGQVGEVGERLVLDLAVLAIGVAQKMGLVDLVLVLTTCSRHMHRTSLSGHKHIIAHQCLDVEHTRVYICEL
jgi:hypothetical protein